MARPVEKWEPLVENEWCSRQWEWVLGLKHIELNILWILDDFGTTRLPKILGQTRSWLVSYSNCFCWPCWLRSWWTHMIGCGPWVCIACEGSFSFLGLYSFFSQSHMRHLGMVKSDGCPQRSESFSLKNMPPTLYLLYSSYSFKEAFAGFAMPLHLMRTSLQNVQILHQNQKFGFTCGSQTSVFQQKPSITLKNHRNQSKNQQLLSGNSR